MLGKVRASPISTLEMERPPSKLIKHDSLSIYESTLLKLKQGSRSNPICVEEDPGRMDSCCSTTCSREEDISNTDCCSTESFISSSSISLKEQKSKNKSIVYFFSKYMTSQEAQSSNDEEIMASGYCCSNV